MVKYNTVLKLSDFADPDFSQLMRAVFPHLAVANVDFPNGTELAKAWEVTQAVRALKDFGALQPEAEILGVAAGFEHTVFYLTNYVKRVFATDLYATNEDVEGGRTPGCCGIQPRSPPQACRGSRTGWWCSTWMHSTFTARMKRFDGVFSCGSIEHFGSLENVAQAAREMARVLKPGGILSLATEFRISGPAGLGIPGAILFTRDMIEKHVIAASGLTAGGRARTDHHPRNRRPRLIRSRRR